MIHRCIGMDLTGDLERFRWISWGSSVGNCILIGLTGDKHRGKLNPLLQMSLLIQ